VNYPITDFLREIQLGANNDKINALRVDVTKNNTIKGYCDFRIVFEGDVSLSSLR